MTNEEAIEYGKKWDEAIESRGDTPFSEARQFLRLAIKALEDKGYAQGYIDGQTGADYDDREYD